MSGLLALAGRAFASPTVEAREPVANREPVDNQASEVVESGERTLPGDDGKAGDAGEVGELVANVASGELVANVASGELVANVASGELGSNGELVASGANGELVASGANEPVENGEPLENGEPVENGEVSDSELDDELARSALDVGSALYDDSLSVMSGLVDVTTYRDAEARHQRPSPFGRLDLVFAWRRTDRFIDHAPGMFVAMPGEPTRRDEVWLVAIWRN